MDLVEKVFGPYESEEEAKQVTFEIQKVLGDDYSDTEVVIDVNHKKVDVYNEADIEDYIQ